jgi:hypothetical protein
MAPAPPSSVVIDSGETFRLRNDHPSETLTVKLGKRSYTIEPSRSALVPFELIRIWWGDPRSRPNVMVKFSDSLESGYVNTREGEIQRLGVAYGSYVADVVSLNDPEWPINDPQYGRVPKRTPWPVTVTTETGVEIVPACFDLTGEAVYATVKDDSRDLNDQVQYREHLEARIDKLSEELRRAVGNDEADEAGVDVPAGR